MVKIEEAKEKLYIEGKLVFCFQYEIQKHIIFENKVIVLLAIPEKVIFNENIFCFNLKGELLWQISQQKEHNEICPFTGLSINSNQFTPYKSCGVLCTVDMNTGKILSSELIK